MAQKYLDSNGLSYLWGKIKSWAKRTLLSNVSYSDGSLKLTKYNGTNDAEKTTVIVSASTIVADGGSGKADKVSGATSGNFAGLDANGNLTDSGHKHSDYLESNQGSANSGKAIVVGSDGSLSPGTPNLSKKTLSIPFGQINSGSTSTVFTATVDGISELTDGVCCYLRNGIISSEDGWTLNINNLGAKPVYSTTSQLGGIFEIDYTMLFVYNSSRVSGGCWDMYYGYDRKLPLLSKVYENYTCSVADVSNGYIYFMKVVPTSNNYYEPWFIHYTLEISTDMPQCQGYYDIIVGFAGSTQQYCIFNKFYSSSYYPSYYHLMSWYNTAEKYANRETYPVRLGERIYSAYQATSRARTYKIKVYETHGCEVTFPDFIETYGSFYSDNNYGTTTTWSAISNGVLDNYDSNTQPYQYFEYYMNYYTHDASTPLFAYRLFGFDKNNKIVPFTTITRTSATQNVLIPKSIPIVVSKGINYYNSTSTIYTDITTARTGNALVYRGITSTNNLSYYNFNGFPPQNCTIYLCGSYNLTTDEFETNSSSLNSWYVFIPDNINFKLNLSSYFQEGYFYWLLGSIGSATSSYGGLYLDNPLYYYDGNSLVPTGDLLNRNNIIYKWNNQRFSKRSTYGKYSREAIITKLYGLSIAWNQLAQSYKVTNGTATTSNGITTVTPTNSNCRYILQTRSADTTAPTTYHLYLQSIIVKSSKPVAFINNSGGMVGTLPTFDFSSGDDFRLCYDYYRAKTGDATTIQIYSPTASTFYIKEGSFMLFDLTVMFGDGLEPTAEEFFELFPKESYAYCEGSLINTYNGQETLNLYDSSDNLIDSVQVGGSLGLKSSGFDYDEAYGTTKITRVGSVNLGSLTWTLYDSSKKIYKCSGFSTTYGASKSKGSYPSSICGGGYSQRISDNSPSSLYSKQFLIGSSSGDLFIRDTAYSTAADFKTAVNNIYLNFALETPVESSISDVEVTYDCDLNGTELALQSYQSSNSNTPTCSPFRCDIIYKQISLGEPGTISTGDIDNLNW